MMAGVQRENGPDELPSGIEELSFLSEGGNTQPLEDHDHTNEGLLKTDNGQSMIPSATGSHDKSSDRPQGVRVKLFGGEVLSDDELTRGKSNESLPFEVCPSTTESNNEENESPYTPITFDASSSKDTVKKVVIDRKDLGRGIYGNTGKNAQEADLVNFSSDANSLPETMQELLQFGQKNHGQYGMKTSIQGNVSQLESMHFVLEDPMLQTARFAGGSLVEQQDIFPQEGHAFTEAAVTGPAGPQSARTTYNNYSAHHAVGHIGHSDENTDDETLDEETNKDDIVASQPPAVLLTQMRMNVDYVQELEAEGFDTSANLDDTKSENGEQSELNDILQNGQSSIQHLYGSEQDHIKAAWNHKMEMGTDFVADHQQINRETNSEQLITSELKYSDKAQPKQQTASRNQPSLGTSHDKNLSQVVYQNSTKETNDQRSNDKHKEQKQAMTKSDPLLNQEKRELVKPVNYPLLQNMQKTDSLLMQEKAERKLPPPASYSPKDMKQLAPNIHNEMNQQQKKTSMAEDRILYNGQDEQRIPPKGPEQIPTKHMPQPKNQHPSQAPVSSRTAPMFLKSSASDFRQRDAMRNYTTASEGNIHDGFQEQPRVSIVARARKQESIGGLVDMDFASLTGAHTSSPIVDRNKKAQMQIKDQEDAYALLSRPAVNQEIHHMENVRDHLHNMLKMSSQAMPDPGEYDQSRDDDAMNQLLAGLGEEDPFISSFRSADSIPASGHSLGGIASHLESILSMGSGSRQGQKVSQSAAVLGAQNHLLQETLEKEQFRRKHLEKQIQQLQSKMLELQQQLAVAVSTDRKKDTMIEQLDKALAKVVEGWKKREAEKQDIINSMSQENSSMRIKLSEQEQMLIKNEQEFIHVAEQLDKETKRADEGEQEKQTMHEEMEYERARNLELLEMERKRLQTTQAERDAANQSNEKLQNQLLHLQQTLEVEKENWEEKERDYLQKIDEITDNHLRSLEQEQTKSSQQSKLLAETQKILNETQTEAREFQVELDNVHREKESLKVAMGLTEARLESSKRKLEAELRGEMERQLSTQLEESHRKQAKLEEELRNRHHHQLTELTHQHAQEMQDLRNNYHEEVQRKDEIIAEQTAEFEERMADVKNEVDNLKVYVKKVEGQRVDLTSRLQSMMQAHCNEALRLLHPADQTRASPVPITQEQQSLLSSLNLMTPLKDPGGGQMYQYSLSDQTKDSSQRYHEQPPNRMTRKWGFSSTSQPSTLDDGKFKPLQASTTPPQHQSAFSVPQHDMFGSSPIHQGNLSGSSGTAEQHQQLRHQLQESQDILQAQHQQLQDEKYEEIQRELQAQQEIRAQQRLQQQAQHEHEQNVIRQHGASAASSNSNSPSKNSVLPGYTGPVSSSAPLFKEPSADMAPSNQTGVHNPNRLLNLSGFAPLVMDDTMQQDMSYSSQGSQAAQRQYPGYSAELNQSASPNSRSASFSVQFTGPAAKVISISQQQSQHQNRAGSQQETQQHKTTHQPANTSRQLSFLETLTSSRYGYEDEDFVESGSEFQHAERFRHSSAAHASGGANSFIPATQNQRISSISEADASRWHGDETAMSTGPLEDESTLHEYHDISRKFDQHENRQVELQHYIKMLLNRSPGETEVDATKEDEPVQDGSGKHSEAQAPSIFTPIKSSQPVGTNIQGRGASSAQGRPIPPAFTKTTVTNPRSSSVPSSPERTPHSSLPTYSPPRAPPHRMNLSPQQMGEISRLLGLYHGREGHAEQSQIPPIGDLMAYLQDNMKMNADLSGMVHQSAAAAAKPITQQVREYPTKDAAYIKRHTTAENKPMVNVKIPSTNPTNVSPKGSPPAGRSKQPATYKKTHQTTSKPFQTTTKKPERKVAGNKKPSAWK